MTKLPTLANKNSCTGCLACVDACSKSHALSYIIAADGHIYPKLDSKKCIGCKSCEKACPIVDSFDYKNYFESKFYAAWNNNNKDRKNSASGGAFSALARFVLDNKGIVIGASQRENCKVEHIAIDNVSDLHLLQGSKYTQSISNGIYLKTLDFLKTDKTVLFSGTGCQVAGLLSFLKNKHFCGRLITIDLICGGVPSKNLIETFRRNEPYVIDNIISYRTKDNGWSPNGFHYNLKVLDSEGRIHDYSGKRDLITKGFAMELTNRWSCYDCQFSGINRKSDLTIGDFWGINRFEEQFHDGISLVVAHNTSSLNLLKEASRYITISEVRPDEAVNHNYRLYTGRSNGAYTLERKMMTWLFKHLSYRNLKRVYAYESPGFFYKVYYHLSRLIIDVIHSNSKNRNK